MKTVNPTWARIEEFGRDTPDDRAIVMVNLLKFRELADYGEGGPGGTGRAAYLRYSKAAVPLVWEVGGQVLWVGKARADVIAPAGESWDEVALVHYPSRRAFLRMIRSNAYQAIMHHRTAGLIDSRLIETRATWLPRLLLGAARGLVRVRAWFSPKIPR